MHVILRGLKIPTMKFLFNFCLGVQTSEWNIWLLLDIDESETLYGRDLEIAEKVLEDVMARDLMHMPSRALTSSRTFFSYLKIPPYM